MTPRKARPPHCGKCDPRTRFREDASGAPHRCPECHPARVATPTGPPPAEDHVDPWWADGARRGLEHLASLGAPFTADDLRTLIVNDPPHPNHWGLIFRAAKRDGIIYEVTTTISRAQSRRSGLIRAWRGTARFVSAHTTDVTTGQDTLTGLPRPRGTGPETDETPGHPAGAPTPTVRGSSI